MRNALAIARKELSIYLTTPGAYLGFTAMVVFTGVFFMAGLAQFRRIQEMALAYTWARMPGWAEEYKNLTDGVVMHLWEVILVLTLFIAPFLSMGLFAREKRHGTFELLMTAPVRPIEMVLGKYLAGVGVIVTTLGLTIIFPLILAAFGQSESGSALEWSTVLLGYLGMLLWGATCMAIGMFISILTRSEALAALLTFAVLLPWYLLRGFGQTSEEPWRSIASNLSFESQLESLTKGVLDLKALVFFASVILLSLFLTHRSVEAHRWA
jgi:ABC-2 type transport system permease protein